MFWQIQLIPSSPCKLLVTVGEKQKRSQTSKHPGMRLEFKAERSLEGMHRSIQPPQILFHFGARMLICQHPLDFLFILERSRPHVCQRCHPTHHRDTGRSRKTSCLWKIHICWMPQVKRNGSSATVSRFGRLHQSKDVVNHQHWLSNLSVAAVQVLSDLCSF